MDVVIVGAGPAGASAARVAAAAGLSTLVIDRKQFAGEPIQCAEWVPRSLLSHVTQHAGCLQRTDNLVTEAPGGMHSVMPMPGAMVDRARFDSVLCANARAQGAKFHWHIRLRAVDPVLRQITVIRNRREMQIRFRRLIAADGPRCRFRRVGCTDQRAGNGWSPFSRGTTAGYAGYADDPVPAISRGGAESVAGHSCLVISGVSRGVCMAFSQG